jgi:hypothetical protein
MPQKCIFSRIIITTPVVVEYSFWLLFCVRSWCEKRNFIRRVVFLDIILLSHYRGFSSWFLCKSFVKKIKKVNSLCKSSVKISTF